MDNNIPTPPLPQSEAQEMNQQPQSNDNIAGMALEASEDQEVKLTDTLWFKVGVIALIALLLLIPKFMISDLNDERQKTGQAARDEITAKWAQPQHVTGPIIAIPLTTAEGEKDIYVLPKTLQADADIKTQTLHRGIYSANVYNSGIDISGVFALPEHLGGLTQNPNLHPDRARVIIGLTDLRGIGKQIKLTLAGKTYEIKDGGIDYYIQNKESALRLEEFDQGDIDTSRGKESVVSVGINAAELMQSDTVPFSLHLDLKGSEMLSFAPVGESSQIRVKGDCATPSFKGFILPTERKVDAQGFEAMWNMIGINRSYPQVFSDNESENISGSHVAVSLKVPVEGGLKTERALKYGLLVIVLTFVAALFTELRTRKRINPFQYVLIGLALVLFYSLLLSIAEHASFGVAYLVASVMTVLMVALYVNGVLRAHRQAALIGGLVALMYAYIYVLLSLETWSLVAGSVGLFIILAAIMYYSLDLRLGARE